MEAFVCDVHRISAVFAAKVEVACYHPLDGYRRADGGWQTGRAGSIGLRMTVPCGRCIGCRLERSRQWAVRCMHEAQMHPDSCFVTLTYSDENVPETGSLDRAAFQRFMKRLRRKLEPVSLRYFHCGEYGDQFGRPHYHACIFGTGFPDRTRWTVRGGNEVWRSEILEEAWPLGHSEIGSLTFESAAYAARYATKKLAADASMDEETYRRWKERYERVNPLTGEVVELEPEYATMSNRPGIGRKWIEKYLYDVYPHDHVISRGFPAKPPRYYDQVLEELDPAMAEEVYARRVAERDRENQTPERLQVREVCTKKRLNLYSNREVAL